MGVSLGTLDRMHVTGGHALVGVVTQQFPVYYTDHDREQIDRSSPPPGPFDSRVQPPSPVRVSTECAQELGLLRKTTVSVTWCRQGVGP